MSKFILIVMLMFCSANIIAENNQPLDTVRLVRKKNGSRPNVPSRVFIEGTLENGIFALQLPVGSEYADLTLFENDAEIWSGTISKSDSYVLLPFLEDGCDYRIVCTLQDNSQYVGFIGL